MLFRLPYWEYKQETYDAIRYVRRVCLGADTVAAVGVVGPLRLVEAEAARLAATFDASAAIRR